jgi:hypothetical protein
MLPSTSLNQPILRGVIPPAQTFIAGLDLGQSQDYSALAILEHAGPGHLPYLPEQIWNIRHLQRWELQTPYPAIVVDVMTMLDQPPLTESDVTLAIDMTGVGRPVVDLFRQALPKPAGMAWAEQAPPPTRPVRLVPIQITGGNQVTRDSDVFNVPKRDLAGVVQVTLQARRLPAARKLPALQVLMQELANFKAKISLAGHDTYGAGSGEEWRVGAHDDLVLAVAIALWAAQRSRGSTLVAI